MTASNSLLTDALTHSYIKMEKLCEEKDLNASQQELLFLRIAQEWATTHKQVTKKTIQAQIPSKFVALAWKLLKKWHFLHSFFSINPQASWTFFEQQMKAIAPYQQTPTINSSTKSSFVEAVFATAMQHMGYEIPSDPKPLTPPLTNHASSHEQRLSSLSDSNKDESVFQAKEKLLSYTNIPQDTFNSLAQNIMHELIDQGKTEQVIQEFFTERTIQSLIDQKQYPFLIWLSNQKNLFESQDHQFRFLHSIMYAIYSQNTDSDAYILIFKKLAPLLLHNDFLQQLTVFDSLKPVQQLIQESSHWNLSYHMAGVSHERKASIAASMYLDKIRAKQQQEQIEKWNGLPEYISLPLYRHILRPKEHDYPVNATTQKTLQRIYDAYSISHKSSAKSILSFLNDNHQKEMIIPGIIEGHFTWYLIQKNTNGSCSISLYNTGVGLEYHYHSTVDKRRYQTHFTIHEIPQTILQQSPDLEGLFSQEVSEVYHSMEALASKGIKEGALDNSLLQLTQGSGACSIYAFLALIRHQILCQPGRPEDNLLEYQIFKQHMRENVWKTVNLDTAVQDTDHLVHALALEKIAKGSDLSLIVSIIDDPDQVNSYLKTLSLIIGEEHNFDSHLPENRAAKIRFLRKLSKQVAIKWARDHFKGMILKKPDDAPYLQPAYSASRYLIRLLEEAEASCMRCVKAFHDSILEREDLSESSIEEEFLSEMGALAHQLQQLKDNGLDIEVKEVLQKMQNVSPDLFNRLNQLIPSKID